MVGRGMEELEIPLTLTLSRVEREQPSSGLGKLLTDETLCRQQGVLPLPLGEGRMRGIASCNGMVIDE